MGRGSLSAFLGALFAFVISGWTGIVAVSAQGDAQQVSGGGVTVTVTFLRERAEELAFRVVLDTHSVNLDGYRFDSVVSLRDESYHWSSPTGVEAVSGSGHHRQAIVKFPRPSGTVDVLEMVVSDVAGVKERHFRWKLQ